MKKKAIKKKTFSNGLRLIMEKVPDTDKVAFFVGGMSGSIHETDRLWGASHFTEHMLFKTNKHRKCDRISKDLEYKGTDVNALTDFDFMAFYAKSFPSNLETAVDVVFEAATNFDYDTEELRTERSRILTEIDMYDDDAIYFLDDRIFMPALFKGTPFERAIIGSKESVGNVTREELLDFKREFYVPNEMVIVALGNFKERDLIKKVRDTFGTLEQKAVPDIDLSVELTNKAMTVIEEKSGINQSYIGIGSKMPAIHEDAYKLTMLSYILSGGMSSRLFQAICEKSGLGYATWFSLKKFKDCGLFSIFIRGFEPKRYDEAVEAILNEYDKLKTELVSKEEFEGMRNLYLSRASDNMKDITKRAPAILMSELKEIPYDYRNYIEDIGKVTRQDVMEMANKYFIGDYLTAALVPQGFKK